MTYNPKYSTKPWKNAFWHHIRRQNRPDHDTCIFCGHAYEDDDPGSPRARSIEHINPVSCGGKNDFHNLAGACRRCNQRRGSMDFIEWGIATQLGQTYSMNVAHLLLAGQKDQGPLPRSIILQFCVIENSAKQRMQSIVDKILAKL